MKEMADLRIVLADDHAFLLQGLADHLTSKGLDVIGLAADGTQALQLIMDERPDVAILDIEMPYLSGLSIAEVCKKKNLPTKIVVLSFHKEQEFITQAKELGISGYVLKEDATTEIEACIRAVSSGDSYFSRALKTPEISQNDSLSQIPQLTPSEKKILKLIADRNSSTEIAELLYISERTVEKHRSNIVAKLNLPGQSNSLTNWATEYKSLIAQL